MDKKNKKEKPYSPIEVKDYTYFYDNNGKLHRFKTNTAPQGIRLKFLEKPYFWWKTRSNDFKNSTIPLAISAFFFSLIYFPSVWYFERKEKLKYDARLPEEALEKNKFEEYKRYREAHDKK